MIYRNDMAMAKKTGGRGRETFCRKFPSPFHRTPIPLSSKTFDFIESLPPCFPVGKSPSPPTGSRGNDGFIPRRQPSQKQKPPELSSDGFLVLKAIFPTCAGTNSRRAASPPVESLWRGWGCGGRGTFLQKGSPSPAFSLTTNLTKRCALRCRRCTAAGPSFR